MARGRCSARRGAVAAFAVACWLIAGCGVASAATTYYVGDGSGWSLSSAASWPNGKQFRAGDVLVFNYSPLIHNVVAVQGDGCATPAGSRTYTSGRDSVTLARGYNRFICTMYGHCYLGMRMVVHAA